MDIAHIEFTYASPEQTFLRRKIIRMVERLTGQPYLKQLYQQYLNQPVNGAAGEGFFINALNQLELSLRFDQSALDNIPKSGPVLFIANHPYGVVDGLALTAMALKVRPDVKVMANQVLCRAPEAAAHLLPVDFAGTRGALQTNIQTRKAALTHLKQGKAIGIFPAGGVAASLKPLTGAAADPQWHVFLAKLAQSSGATIIPVYFQGQNSRLFQVASHFSYTMRLALFFHETRRMVGRSLTAMIGEPISPQDIAQFKDKEELMVYLRQKTFELGKQLPQRVWELPRADQVFHYPERLKISS